MLHSLAKWVGNQAPWPGEQRGGICEHTPYLALKFIRIVHNSLEEEKLKHANTTFILGVGWCARRNRKAIPLQTTHIRPQHPTVVWAQPFLYFLLPTTKVRAFIISLYPLVHTAAPCPSTVHTQMDPQAETGNDPCQEVSLMPCGLWSKPRNCFDRGKGQYLFLRELYYREKPD